MGRACATRLGEIVDVLLLVDRDEQSVNAARDELAAAGAQVEAVVLDVTDADALARLAGRIGELGTLRAVAHAAGVSPTMGDWRKVVTVDLVGTAALVEALVPLAAEGTAVVCFASIAPLLAVADTEPDVTEAVDAPLHPRLLERLHDALGATIEDPGMAYVWAKWGVLRLVQREAVRLGRLGARICSVSPGIIDTPMGRDEHAARDASALLVEHTPLGREGQAEEVAAAVSFLLSDEAGFINGIDLPVDGGVVAAMRTSFASPDEVGEALT